MPCHLMAESENGAPIKSQVWGVREVQLHSKLQEEGALANINPGKDTLWYGWVHAHACSQPQGYGKGLRWRANAGERLLVSKTTALEVWCPASPVVDCNGWEGVAGADGTGGQGQLSSAVHDAWPINFQERSIMS